MIQFNTADKQTLAALQRMNAPEMRPLLEFFKKLAADTDVSLRRVNVDDFQQLQGRAIIIEDFLKAVAGAADVLERMP